MRVDRWEHQNPIPCDMCGRAITYRQYILPSARSKAAHAWCVLGVPEPRPPAVTDVEKPTYLPSGMIHWRGHIYDPARAAQIEPGCTREELLGLAPTGWNGVPLRWTAS